MPLSFKGKTHRGFYNFLQFRVEEMLSSSYIIFTSLRKCTVVVWNHQNLIFNNKYLIITIIISLDLILIALSKEQLTFLLFASISISNTIYE